MGLYSTTSPDATPPLVFAQTQEPDVQFFVVDGAIWRDQWVSELSAYGKLFWCYLITHPDSDNGFIHYTPKVWAAETEIPRADIESLFAEFEAAGKVARENGMALVVKHITHRRLAGNNLTGAIKSIEKMRERYPVLTALCFQANPVLTRLEPRPDPLDTSLHQESLHQNQSKKPTPEQELPADASATERLILAETRKWRGYTRTSSQALDYLRELYTQFPLLSSTDILEVCRDLTAWLDKPKNSSQTGSNARWRNFCKNAKPGTGGNGHVAPPPKQGKESRSLAEIEAERLAEIEWAKAHPVNTESPYAR